MTVMKDIGIDAINRAKRLSEPERGHEAKFVCQECIEVVSEAVRTGMVSRAVVQAIFDREVPYLQ